MQGSSNIIYINKDRETIEKIENPLIQGNNGNNVHLENYLNGIKGQVNIPRKLDSIFVRDFQDINFVGDPVIYDGNKLIEIEEDNEINLLDYLIDYELTVLDIPIVEDSLEFDKVLDVIEDVKEAFEIYVDKYNSSYITIIANEQIMEEARVGFVDPYDEIMPGLTVSDFSDYGQDSYAHTYVKRRQKVFYHLNEHPLFLSLNDNLRYYRNNNKLFIRDILVTDFKLDLPNSIYDLTIDGLKINIKNDEVVANVTRNSLQNEKLIEVKIAIYQAILFYIFEELSDEVQKNTILNFIRKYHFHNTQFLKKKYSELLAN